MSFSDDVGVGISALAAGPIVYLFGTSDSESDTSGTTSGGDVSFSSSGADLTPAKAAAAPVAPNGAFSTGLNLLVSDPAGFFHTLFGGPNAANDLPVSEVKNAAEKPLSANLPTIPTWVKVTLIAGVVVGGLLATGFILHEIRKV